MDFQWNGEYHQKFITNVGLISSNGKHGPNMMAAEWTYLTSYSPAMILISVGPTKATAENINETKKFGVSLAAEDQGWICSIAGGHTGKSTDKIAALSELGVTFTEGKHTGMKLVNGAALHAECEVVEVVHQGDHTLYIGKVIDAQTFDAKPIALHGRKYWMMTTHAPHTNAEEREKRSAIVEKHKK
ncbi:MAG: flavin reductase family protein [archaeon]